VKVLVTSRAPLQLAAEQVYPVSPLPLPPLDPGDDLSALSSVPSVQLFVDRAIRTVPEFALTADNAEPVARAAVASTGCRWGSSWRPPGSLLEPAGVRDRLASRMALPGPTVKDAPLRQRTLRDTVAWSHDLLDGPRPDAVRADGGLRRRLSPGRARASADQSELGADVLGTVASLVDRASSWPSSTAPGSDSRCSTPSAVRLRPAR
jgi:predicted ATPase